MNKNRNQRASRGEKRSTGKEPSHPRVLARVFAEDLRRVHGGGTSGAENLAPEDEPTL